PWVLNSKSIGIASICPSGTTQIVTILAVQFVLLIGGYFVWRGAVFHFIPCSTTPSTAASSLARLQAARAAVAIGRPTHRSQPHLAKNNANPIGTTHPSQSRHSVEPIRPPGAAQIVILFAQPVGCSGKRFHPSMELSCGAPSFRIASLSATLS